MQYSKPTPHHGQYYYTISSVNCTSKSNSHISHSFVASVYKLQHFQCIFSSSSNLYSNVSRYLLEINILQCTYVHPSFVLHCVYPATFSNGLLTNNSTLSFNCFGRFSLNSTLFIQSISHQFSAHVRMVIHVTRRSVIQVCVQNII